MRTKKLLVLACLTVGVLAQINAQDRGFYFKFDVGGAWNEKTEVKELLGESATGKVEFDPGPRLDLGVGYQFNRWVSTEFEIGYIYNNIDRFNNAQQFGDSSLQRIPMMVNVVLHAPVGERLVPFVGAGAGGVANALDIDGLYLPQQDVFIEGSDTDMTFGWQAFAGLKFIVDDHWDVGLAYKYLWTESPSWEVRPDFFGGPFERIKFGNIRTHSVVLAASWRF